MSTSIVATVEDTNKLKIQKIFQKAIEGSSSEEICTNGSYRISPRYIYDDGKRVFLGYQGDITFKCEFEDSKKLDNVINKLDRLTVEKDKVKLIINPISWIADNKTIKQVNKELELEALNYATSYKKFLSDVYKTACNIKEISLNSASTPVYPMPMYSMMKESKSQTTQPIKSNQTLKSSASYKFECSE